MNRTVALKTVLASHASDKSTLARFEQEAVTIARLSHPNIVGALDFGRNQGRLFLAMEIVRGEDLGHFIDHSGQLDERFCWGIARQVAAGLAHASRFGVIHRDIKPANILLVESPEGFGHVPGLPMAKITDFGLALLNHPQEVQARLTAHNSALGSPHYMAPEQLGKDEMDTRADIYALGATVFQMLTGQPPWAKKSLQHIVAAKLKGQIPSLTELRPTVSPMTVDLWSQMMASEVAARPADCNALLSAIDQVLSTQPTVETTLGETATLPVPSASMIQTDALSVTTTKTRRPRKLRMVTTVAVLLLLGGLLWLAYNFVRNRIPGPIELEPTENQALLFDGTSPMNQYRLKSNGGWEVRDGMLIHVAGRSASITYEIPAWEFFSFQANVGGLAGNRVDVEFGAMGRGDDSRRYALRLRDGTAQVISIVGTTGEWRPMSPALALNTSRAEHFLRIERNAGVWIVEVDRQQVGNVALNSRGPPLNQIKLVFEKQSDEAIETAALRARKSLPPN